MTKKKYIKRANSKDSLRAYSPNNEAATVFPDFSFQSVINMINNDPVARGAINHYVSKCMEGTYNILNRKTKKLDDSSKFKLEEKYKFRQMILRKTFLLGKLFNNVYIEIVRTLDNQTKDLNVLDSLNIEPITLENGDPKGYQSRQFSQLTGKKATWDAKDITWIKFGDRSVGYAPVDLRALWENLCIKDWVKRYVGWLWKTGQYRVLYNPINANDKNIQDFLAYNRRAENNFSSPMMLSGELQTKVLRDMKEAESIDVFLKYLDGQTLILLRMPPSDAGIPDASGRSNSDAQTNNLNTSITDFKQIVADYINYDLFPKMNKSNSMIKFGPNDRFQRQMVFDNLSKFKSVGATNDALREFLEIEGIYFEVEKMFEDIPDPMEMASMKGPQIQSDNAPSRQGKSAGVGNKKIGTGSQGTTRSDQLRKE